MRGYAKQMVDFIRNNIYFTAKDVITITNTTCPHGVVQDLRKRFNITDEYTVRNGKRFKIYKFEGPLCS